MFIKNIIDIAEIIQLKIGEEFKNSLKQI